SEIHWGSQPTILEIQVWQKPILQIVARMSRFTYYSYLAVNLHKKGSYCLMHLNLFLNLLITTRIGCRLRYGFLILFYLAQMLKALPGGTTVNLLKEISMRRSIT
ncbi:hypothetical protein ACJX0J_010993, partial [Zea mays]